MNLLRKTSLFFIFTIGGLFSMEEPLFIKDRGKWTSADVEKVLDIKKDDDYVERLQIAASTLLDQDNFVRAFLHLKELGEKVDSVQEVLTKTLGPEAITTDGRVFFSYLFPEGNDAFVAVLKYRAFFLSDYIFDVQPNEDVIKEAIATLKSFSSDETVNKLGKILEGKLERALLMRAQIEAGSGYEDVKEKDAAWTVFFQKKPSMQHFKEEYLFFRYLKDDVIKRMQRLFQSDKRTSAQERQEDQMLQALGEACERYKEKRLKIQQLYSFMVKELNKVSRAYYYDPTFTSVENKPVAVGVTHIIKLLSSEEPSTTKKKKIRKRKKQSKDNGTVTVQSDGIELAEKEEEDEEEERPLEATASMSVPQKTSSTNVSQKKSEFKDVVTHSGITQSPLWVKVSDPSQKVVWRIYKMTGNSLNFTLPEIKYSSQVELWINNPREALSKKGYNDPNSEKSKDAMRKGSYKSHEQMRQMISLYESFSHDCDAFILKYGTYSDQIDKTTGRSSIKIVAPGHCEYDGKSITGLFVLVIDKRSGYCFHRMFEPKELKWQDPDLYNVNIEFNFPPLSELH